jgi:hypothetical protein
VNPRVVGSILGLLIGMGLVVYLEKNEVLSRGRGPKPAPSPSSTPTPLSQEEETMALHKLTRHQAEEIARLRRAKDAAEALDLLLAPRSPRDPTRPEQIRLSALSSIELNNEIETAVEEAASYTAGGAYAPERHVDLHKRVNNLWSLPNLTDKQNKWLQKAVKELNDLAVRHAEEAIERGDEDEAIRAADGIGEWAWRLNADQKKRFLAAVTTAESRLR